MGMRVSCLQDNLARGLNIVSAAVGKRTSLPVLENILLTTDNGRLQLAATDTSMGIRAWIGASVEEDGAITVSARTLRDLVNTLSVGRVDMEVSVRTQSLHLSSGASKAQIKGIDAAEFPLMPEPAEEDDTIAIPASILKESIKMVAFAAARDDTRPILTGVLLAYEDDILTLAAAAGFRLSVREIPIETEYGKSFSLVVPARALQEVERVIDPEQDEFAYLSIPADRQQVIFSLTSVDIDSRTIDGEFPDFHAIIPRETPTRTVLDTADFLRAVTRADIFAREANNMVRLSVEPQDGMAGVIRVTASDQEIGENEGIVDASIEGDGMEVAFNARYLMDVLKVIRHDNIQLGTSQQDKPGLISPVGDETYSHVIMPMHINR
ncbi:MAG: DNA polymerase III subunit beta [Anaerolineae bacterium]